jgi:hypothetical protein
MVVAPKLDHGMVGKFECRDGYMLKGHNTTQCFFGNWTGMTPWCKEGKTIEKNKHLQCEACLKGEISNPSVVDTFIRMKIK